MATPSIYSSPRRSSRRSPATVLQSQSQRIMSKESRRSELQFVNITDEGRLDQPARTQVRTQVMLEFHRKRRQGTNGVEGSTNDRAPSPRASGSANKGLRGQSSKLKLGPMGLQQWTPRKRGKAQVQRKDTVAQKAQGRVGDGVVITPPETIASIGELIDKEVELGGERGDQSSENPFGQYISRETIASDIELTQAYGLLDVNVIPREPPSSAWTIDPFNVVSLLIQPRTQALLYYYFNERLRSSWLMMPIRKGLLSLAIHDEALFHACISQYAASFYLRQRAGDPVESVTHRTEAIRIVNERLGDPIKRLSDGTIAAVANIAIYESANGSLSSVQVHLNGLEQMVRMRGGIKGGNFPFFVQRLLAWCDLHCANALSQKPRFPPLDVDMISSPNIPPSTPPSPPIFDSFIAPESLLSIDSILLNLRSLSGTLQEVTPEHPENIWYSDQVYAVQRRLFDLSFAPLPRSPSKASTLLEKCVATAALIFSYAALRDIPFNFRVVATMVTNLRSTLELLFQAADTEDWARCSQAILESKPQRVFWTLALGGMAAEGKAEYSWFCEKFASMCAVLGVGSWKEMKAGLEGVLWRVELDDSGKKLWDEVEGLGRS